MAFNKVDSFLFLPANPKHIILFRTLLALMLCYVFAPRGLMPIFPLSNFPELHAYLFSNWYYCLMYLLLILFALGVKSQITSFILFLVLLPHVFLIRGHLSKQVILCVLMCFVFIKTPPIWKAGQNSFQNSEISPMWPIRLIQIQLTLVYGINALAKTNFEYLSGEALVYMSMGYPNFHIDLSDGYLHLNSIKIPAYLMAVSSVLTEYFLAVGFWFKRTKWIAVVVGVLFHFSLTFILTIFMLDYVSIFLYLSFIIPFKLKTV
ncbi:HTTM domain-containing protein [Hyunsoonleella rubra]|uniref:HTTM domain-containing protein n=1 Tax=Hyunsoonleella rubra TaxID=1737062 RepID=A0ABW5TEZ9_9FLAO